MIDYSKKRRPNSKDLFAEANKLESIRINNINILKNKYNMSRNIKEKIYRSGTEDMAIHPLGK